VLPIEKIAHVLSSIETQSFYIPPSFSIIRTRRMIGIYTKKIADIWVGVACDEQRAFGTTFASSEKEALKGLLSSIPFNAPFQVFSVPSAFAESVLAKVKDVYDGKEVSRLFPLAMDHLTAYTKKVLRLTVLVPLGYVTTYGSLAKVAGGSPRAVGNVMAANAFAPIVPCHRVVSSDFTLGGYGGGLDVKLQFLIREKRGYQSSWEIPSNEGDLAIFPVEFVLRKLEKD
jgi:methylated-DNA-[protein]-cysteine S-methyltransferase